MRLIQFGGRFLHSAMLHIAPVEMTRVSVFSCESKNGGFGRNDRGGRALVEMTGVSALRLK